MVCHCFWVSYRILCHSIPFVTRHCPHIVDRTYHQICFTKVWYYSAVIFKHFSDYTDVAFSFQILSCYQFPIWIRLPDFLPNDRVFWYSISHRACEYDSNDFNVEGKLLNIAYAGDLNC